MAFKILYLRRISEVFQNMSTSNSYAVVKTSGRQYRVSPGDSFSVEKLEGTPGSKIQIKEVLMLGGKETVFGTPYVPGATVTCIVEEQFRGPKILVFKKKRRHKYRKMRGHRSELTRLFVSEIATPSGVVKAEGHAHVLDADHAKKVADKKAALKAAAPVDGDQPRKAAAPKTAKKKSAPKRTGGAKSKSKTKKS
jgi:large subunit ribosomal protein L21